MRHLLLLDLILVALTAMGAQFSATSSEQPSFIYVTARKYEPLAWAHGKDRFPQGAKLFIQSASGHLPLIPQFAASADPAVSFDGKRLLFAGRKTPREHWQIWEMELSGGAPRRLTNCAENCIRPFYLPEDRFVFAELWRNGSVVKAASLDGSKLTTLTYDAGYSLPSDILRDGRILFDTAFSASGRVEIYTVYSDGSGVESYRCDHAKGRHSGRQLASGDIVFANEDGLARFTSALAHAVGIQIASGEFAGDVTELNDENWLLASRPSPASSFQIFRWSPGIQRLEAILSDDRFDLAEPTPVLSRAVPNRHPSALHDWNYANLLCLNAYTSKLHIPEGAISAVRLYTQDGAGHMSLLGTTPVEKDGSFYLRTPGDRPLKIELLDSSGKTLQKEAGWFWLRRGEQRICVGCHAGPETAPENKVPAVLLRSILAADMTHTASGGH